MTGAARAYVELPADDRQEFRLSSVLKAHLTQVASALGTSVAAYVVEALAERVARDIVEVGNWNLTIPEQSKLLGLLSSPPKPSRAMVKAMEHADELFGALARTG